ncbi:MAG: prephenate dehydrogenase [Lachnospiraceae bacterium]|nr:prephenate dehydrogenase [Lachnospiraceae bacterium]
MKPLSDSRILIVGLGLMGGSYAYALTAKGLEVGAISRKQSTIDYALKEGMIRHGSTEVTKEYVEKFDIIVFALYPHIFIEWIEKYQDYFKKGAILTDVTGVKGSVVYKIQGMLRDDVEFIGAHPMAGREKSGVEYATADIFKGANYIVTPTEKNTEEGIEICKDLGRLLGCERIKTLTPKEHDEMIGFLSQLTHCIAVSLMVCKDCEDLADYTGDSFRDLTRIANINDEMWSELFILNKEELLAQMDLFMDRFSKLKDYIENEDVSGMREMMKLSTERRERFG